jgi:hypothetical protein
MVGMMGLVGGKDDQKERRSDLPASMNEAYSARPSDRPA